MNSHLRIIVFLLLGSFAHFKVSAQSEMLQLLTGGINDFKILGDAYAAPFGKAFGTSVCGGWYNTAATHKRFGFDLTLSVNAVRIPDRDENFNLDELRDQLKIVQLPQNAHTSNTIFGNNEPGPLVGYKISYTLPTGQQIEVSDSNVFALPPGAGMKEKLKFNMLPVPMAEISFGLGGGTDIMGRFFPESNFDDNKGHFGMWGLGIKHDFKQWIPSSSNFDASVMIAYTRIYSGYKNIGYYPTDYLTSGPSEVVDSIFINRGQAFIDEIKGTQKLDFSASGLTANLIVSKKIKFLTFYGSAGWFKSSFDLKLKGKFALPEPFVLIDTSNPVNEPEIKVKITEAGIIEDPITFNFPNSGLRIGAGLRIKILVFTLHAGYTYQNYSIFSAGLGLSFR